MSRLASDGERLSRLEGAYEHLATKVDVERVRTDLGRVESRLNLMIVVMLGGFGVLIPLVLTSS
jgi:hypothetical protein